MKSPFQKVPIQSQEVLAPPEGKDKPKPVKEKELDDFRRIVYESQVQGGRIVPSSAAPSPNEAMHTPF